MPAPFRSSSARSFSEGFATNRKPRLGQRTCTLLVVLAVGASACSSRPNVFSESREARLVRLEEERADLGRASDPVQRTRIQIRISDLMISFMGDAVADGDMARVETRMSDYREAIHGARDAILTSGRDPARDAAGYRDLEIALRQQIRQLDDIGASLALADREPIEGLIVEVTEIRNELLNALFPEADPA